MLDETPDAFEILAGARLARSEPERSEAAVLGALQVAPDDRLVRMGAYKFYFYNNRLSEAAPHALWCIRDAARALGVAEDWRKLPAGSVDCADYDKPKRYLVQSIVAYGYCNARTGKIDLGLEALAKAAEIDPQDTFKATRIAAIIKERLGEAEE